MSELLKDYPFLDRALEAKVGNLKLAIVSDEWFATFTIRDTFEHLFPHHNVYYGRGRTVSEAIKHLNAVLPDFIN